MATNTLQAKRPLDECGGVQPGEEPTDEAVIRRMIACAGDSGNAGGDIPPDAGGGDSGGGNGGGNSGGDQNPPPNTDGGDTGGVPPIDFGGGLPPGWSVSHGEHNPAGGSESGGAPAGPLDLGGPLSPNTVKTVSTGGGGGSVVVNVQVTNAETIGREVAQTVAAAVQNAIKEGATTASTVVTGFFSRIGDFLKQLAADIWNNLKSVMGVVLDAITRSLSGIYGVLKSMIGTLFNAIGEVVKTVVKDAEDLIVKVAGVVDNIAKQVQAINDTLIQPIANVINTTMRTISTLTIAIEKDLHSGLSGLLQVPADVANAMTTLDATMQRTVQQLGETNKEVAHSTVDYEGSVLPPLYAHAHLDAFKGQKLGNPIASTYGEIDKLSTESLQQISTEAIAGLGNLLKELMAKTGEMAKEPFTNLHASWDSVGSVFVALLDGLLSIVVTAAAATALAEPLVEAAVEEAHKRVPITKLDIATTIQAYQRKFLDEKTTDEELRTKGLDATRAQVLKDLAVFLADVQQAIDWWYRGLITDDDFANNLRQHGVIDRDIELFKAGTAFLPNDSTIGRWLNFGAIGEDTAKRLLSYNRWDADTIEAWFATRLQRVSTQTRANLDGRLTASGKGWLNQTFLLPTPQEVVDAASREGVHPDDARLIWMGHWNLPQYLQIVQSYFRGMRTYTEVGYAMEAQNIPHELWDELIQIMRPLIPFRSIPSFVKAGIMSEQEGYQELAKHGFDTRSQQIIMKYATAAKSNTAAKTAQTIHALSVNQAKVLFDDGVMPEADYVAILEAHGYTPEQAQAQAQIDLIGAAAKQRKQEISDIEAQVEAGLMDMDTALQQMTNDGFSQAEIAKMQTAILRAQTKNVKKPSQAEMAKLYKANLITLQQYKDGMVQSGWLEPWLSAFLGLDAPPDAIAALT